MYVKLIPKVIQEKLKARERALAFQFNYNFGDDRPKGILDISDMGSRSVFVRMCSNKLNTDNILISGGELNTNGEMASGLKFGINSEFFGLYNSSVDKSGKDYGKRPIGGIKNIEVSYKGSYKAIREAKVSWVVGSIADLERLTPYFLTLGKTIVLDWGWVNPKASSFSDMFNGEPPFVTFKDGKFQVDQSIFNNPQNKIQNAGGDYDALGGKVSNFEMQLRQDGGFDCTTTITAIGSVLFKKPIDKPSNMINIEEAKDGKVAYDNDNIINAIINLPSIFKEELFGSQWNTRGGDYLIKGRKPRTNSNYIVHEGTKNGFAVDSKNNPQVIWMSRNGEEDFFVKWGYFEDQIVNRYASVKGGEKGDVKITFRSIDSVIDEKTGLPKLNYDEIAEELNIAQDLETEATNIIDNATYEANSNRFDSSGFVINNDSPDIFDFQYIVKQGDTLQGIANELGTTLEDLALFNDLVDPYVIFPGQRIGHMGSNEDVLDRSYSTGNLQADKLYDEAADLREKNKGFRADAVKFERDERKQINESNRFEYLKKPTLIKNVRKFLKPKEIFKFFATDLLPTSKELGIGKTTDFFKFYQKLSSIKDKKFTDPVNNQFGRLRYMWVNVKEIQNAFGITYDTDTSKEPTNINPPKTLEIAIKNLLIQLNKNFYDFWNFELTMDTYDPSNMKVIDKKAVDISNENIVYSKFKPNSHEISKRGIYKFPSFKAGSIVKNQSLQFKIPDAMALTILYGSNKKEKKNQAINIYNNPEVMKLFDMDDGSSVWDDRYLSDMKSSYIPNSVASGSSRTFQNVGSQNVSHHSKLVDGYGLKVQPQKWWTQWSGENKADESTLKGSNKYAEPRVKFEIINDDLVFMKEEFDTKTLREQAGEAPLFGNREIEVRKEDAKFILQSTPSLYKRDKEDSNIFKVKPGVEKVLRNRLSGGIRVGTQDTIKVDTILPAELSLEVDGIGGLVPGDICHTDYIQPKYNVNFKKDEKDYGPFTYFMIKGISQKVDSSGWITEIETIMRKNHIPDVEDIKPEKENEVVRVDESPPELVRPSIPVPIDDEDIADEVTLDDLDFDDFSNWQEPLPKVPEVHSEVEKILNTGTTNIPTKSETFRIGSFEEFVDTENLRANTSNQILLPKISPGLGDLVQKGSTYNNLQLKKNFELIPPANRPYVRVPTDDEDENIDDEIAALGPQEPLKGDDYSNWDEPPLPVTTPPKDESDLPESMPVTIIDKKAEEIKSRDIRTKKSAASAPAILSTYTGDYWQNDLYLYNPPHKPEWRPIFEWPDGSRKNYDVEKDSDGNVTGKAVKTIRAAKDFDVRQQYWDDNIEAPNEGGKSKLNHEGAYNPRKTFTKSNTKRDSDNEYLSGEFGDYYASLGF